MVTNKRLEYMIKIRRKKIKKLKERYRDALQAGCITRKIEDHIKWLETQIYYLELKLKNKNGINKNI